MQASEHYSVAQPEGGANHSADSVEVTHSRSSPPPYLTALEDTSLENNSPPPYLDIMRISSPSMSPVEELSTQPSDHSSSPPHLSRTQNTMDSYLSTPPTEVVSTQPQLSALESSSPPPYPTGTSNPSAPPIEIIVSAQSQPSALESSSPPPYPTGTSNPSAPPIEVVSAQSQPESSSPPPYPTRTSNPSAAPIEVVSTQPSALESSSEPPYPTRTESSSNVSNPSAPPIEVVIPSTFSPPPYPTATITPSPVQVTPTENVVLPEQILYGDEPPPYRTPAAPTDLPKYVLDPSYVTAMVGDSPALRFTVTSSPPLPENTTHTLTHENGEAVTDRFRIFPDRILFCNVQMKDSGRYIISCQNSAGLVATETLALNVNPRPHHSRFRHSHQNPHPSRTHRHMTSTPPVEVVVPSASNSQTYPTDTSTPSAPPTQVAENAASNFFSPPYPLPMAPQDAPKYVLDPSYVTAMVGDSPALRFTLTSSPSLPENTTHTLTHENGEAVTDRFRIFPDRILFCNVQVEDSGTYIISCWNSAGLVATETLGLDVSPRPYYSRYHHSPPSRVHRPDSNRHHSHMTSNRSASPIEVASTQPTALDSSRPAPYPTRADSDMGSSNPSAPPLEVVYTQPLGFESSRPPPYPTRTPGTSTFSPPPYPASLSATSASPAQVTPRESAVSSEQHLLVEEPPPYQTPTAPPDVAKYVLDPSYVTGVVGDSPALRFTVTSSPPLPENTTHTLTHEDGEAVTDRFRIFPDRILFGNVEVADSGKYIISCRNSAGLVVTETLELKIFPRVRTHPQQGISPSYSNRAYYRRRNRRFQPQNCDTFCVGMTISLCLLTVLCVWTLPCILAAIVYLSENRTGSSEVAKQNRAGALTCNVAAWIFGVFGFLGLIIGLVIGLQ